MPKKTAPQMKWQLMAWPDGRRFVKIDGKTRSTAVFRRDYTSPASANRAAPQVRRLHPDAQLEITEFVYRGLFWMGKDTEKLYWCFSCGGRLDWAADAWICTRCGDEWHDEQVRPSIAKKAR